MMYLIMTSKKPYFENLQGCLNNGNIASSGQGKQTHIQAGHTAEKDQTVGSEIRNGRACEPKRGNFLKKKGKTMN